MDSQITALVGVTLSSIHGLRKESEEVRFVATDSREWRMWHQQDCCESVVVDDVVGEVADLIGGEIVEAYESTESGDNEDRSETWTFYRLRTNAGTVTIKWHGESNGYYSESVSFEAVLHG